MAKMNSESPNLVAIVWSMSERERLEGVYLYISVRIAFVILWVICDSREQLTFILPHRTYTTGPFVLLACHNNKSQYEHQHQSFHSGSNNISHHYSHGMIAVQDSVLTLWAVLFFVHTLQAFNVGKLLLMANQGFTSCHVKFRPVCPFLCINTTAFIKTCHNKLQIFHWCCCGHCRSVPMNEAIRERRGDSVCPAIALVTFSEVLLKSLIKRGGVGMARPVDKSICPALTSLVHVCLCCFHGVPCMPIISLIPIYIMT